MGRLTPEDAEMTAYMIEKLFAELKMLRDFVADLPEFDEDELPRVNEAATRVALLNLMDIATEQDMKGTALTELPSPEGDDDWEWVPTVDLVKALNAGMSALVRDMSTLRIGSEIGRELDVLRFRAAWNALADRQIEADGATIRVINDTDGDVGLKVLFEPPMTNPFKPETKEDDLTPAQIVVGNMMAYAFRERNAE